MSYKIGQVIFAVLNRKNHVYPMQVTEIITKKTMKGEVISYKLQGGPDKSTSILLEQIDGEIFETADVARAELINRATKQINKLVDSAVVKASEWYGENRDLSSIDGLPDFTMKKSSMTIEDDTIMLEDGTIAKVRLPSALTG